MVGRRMVMDSYVQTEAEDIRQEKQKMIELGTHILKNWELTIHEIEVIQWGQITLVWKIESDQGLICLKKLNRPEKNALFSIRAQEYLNKKGVHVPGIFPNKQNELYTMIGSSLFVVYDWIEGTHLTGTPEDVHYLMTELATFHQASIGYEVPSGVPIVSKLGKWPEHYLKRCQQLESWKQFAYMEADDSFSQMYLQEIDDFIEICRNLHQKLLRSEYGAWVEKIKKAPNLCHPDYGIGNTLVGNDGHFWLIDLDTVCFDLPIRDVRKMFESFIKSSEPWNDEVFHMLLAAYESVTPLTHGQKQVLLIDLLFPHELYGIAQKKYLYKEAISSEELRQAIAFERVKQEQMSLSNS